MFFKIVVFKNFQISQEKTCVGVFFMPEIATQVLSCEIGETFKNTFFYRTPLVALFNDHPGLGYDVHVC